MKEIPKIVQKLSREQESAAAPAATQAAAPAVAYEPVQKHKVTPGIPGWLDNSINYQSIETVIPRISQWNSQVAFSYKSSFMLQHDAIWDCENKTDNKLKYNFQLFRIAPINDKSLRKEN